MIDYVHVMFYRFQLIGHGGGHSLLAEADMAVLPRIGEYIILHGWGHGGIGISPYLRAKVNQIEHRVFDQSARQPSITAYVYVTPVGEENNDGESSQDRV